jgi:hypothetical protein
MIKDNIYFDTSLLSVIVLIYVSMLLNSLLLKHALFDPEKTRGRKFCNLVLMLPNTIKKIYCWVVALYETLLLS